MIALAALALPIGAVVLVALILTAPRGWEDDSGFHFGEQDFGCNDVDPFFHAAMNTDKRKQDHV